MIFPGSTPNVFGAVCGGSPASARRKASPIFAARRPSWPWEVRFGAPPKPTGWQPVLPGTVPLLTIIITVIVGLSSCTTPDTHHRLIVSVPEQKLVLLQDGAQVATYPISTSKFAIGDLPGSRGTPLGELEVAKKIGTAAPLGTVFKDRRPTGEIVASDSPGRDPIVTRILWLRGREVQNANAYGRYIYIHGTPEERNIGRPASYGCIRMKSIDVAQLYGIVGTGARVSIINAPLITAIPAMPLPAEVATSR